jgi:hypothetical protein
MDEASVLVQGKSKASGLIPLVFIVCIVAALRA